MPKPSELKRLPFKLLLYGPPKSGKTALTMTLGPAVEILDVDYGWLTATQFKDKWFEARNQVEITQCHEEPSQAGSGLMKVKNRLTEIQRQVAGGTYKYKALAIDSLTSLGDSTYRKLAGMPVGTMMNVQARMSIEKWGDVVAEIRNILGLLRHLPIAVILIAHDSIQTVSGINRVLLSAVTRKIPEEAPAYYDEVWHTEVQFIANVQKFIVRTQQTAEILAGSRAALEPTLDQSLGLEALLQKAGYTL